MDLTGIPPCSCTMLNTSRLRVALQTIHPSPRPLIRYPCRKSCCSNKDRGQSGRSRLGATNSTRVLLSSKYHLLLAEPAIEGLGVPHSVPAAGRVHSRGPYGRKGELQRLPGLVRLWCGDGAAALLPVIIWATGTVAVVAVVARLLSPQSFRCSRTAAGLLLWFLTLFWLVVYLHQTKSRYNEGRP